jgi:hypothetical protein
MNNVEKAFTYRLYCPRKQVVKRSVARFGRCELRNDLILRESALGNRGASYCLGGSAGSGACSLWM